MIDFFAYVVAELKSKRLSRTNAVELVRQFSGRCSSSTAPLIIHPLLHRNTSDLAQQRYSSTFTGEEFFLVDHQLKVEESTSRKIFPGAAYLEMARAAIEQALPDRSQSAVLQLHTIVWMQPIFVGERKEVSIALWHNDDQQIDYEIYTQDAGKKVIHCQGRALCSLQPPPPPLNIEQLEKQLLRESLPADAVYATFLRMGMVYGAGFQAVTAIHRGNDQVLAHLRLPGAVEDNWGDYVFHPSLIDGALQACVGLAGDTLESSNHPRLPYALESIRMISPCRREMLAWLRCAPGSRPGDDDVKVDIDLCDKQGNVCVALRGFSYRTLKSNQGKPMLGRQAYQSELQSFVPFWNPLSANTHQLLPASTKILLLAADQADLEWVKKSYADAHLVPLPPAASIDVIVASLTGCSFEHLLWIAPDHVRADDRSGEGDQPLIEPQALGVMAVFRIIKALLHLGYGDKELRWTLITGNTQRVAKHERVEPAHAAIFGLIGSLAKEYPQWNLSLLDVDSLQALDAQQCLSMPPDKRGNGLAHRAGIWFSQQFSHISIPSIASIPPAHTTIRYKQNGVYVVIGGAGGLGEVWTRFVLEHYQANVIWIGRRKLDPHIEARIASLAHLGPAPVYFSADATNFEELEQVCKSVLQKYPAIHGVVHSAIVLHDQTIAHMDEAQFQAGLSAKVDVSVHLDRVFGKQELDFMLFFSSVVSFVKSPGQSNYAAGSTFADSFAHRLEQQRPYPVKIMNWGYWGSVGRAADESYNKNMERMGIASIEPSQGMACLQTFLSSDLSQMAVIKMIGDHAIPYVDVAPPPQSTSGECAPPNQVLDEVLDGVLDKVFDEALPTSEREISTAPSPGAASKQVAVTDEALREKGVSYFQRLIASTLKMRPEQIEPRRPLADYGLDSILVGQLTFRLRKVFPGVTGMLLFEVKNVEGLVDYFLENMKTELAAVLLPPAAATPQTPPTITQQPKAAQAPANRSKRSGASSIALLPREARTSAFGHAQSPPAASGSAARSRAICDVAVIGLSGRYPGSANLQLLWSNLANGVNCITEIPRDRWNWEDYYDPEKGKSGKIYTRWGGFLEGIDRFDPLFFKIAPQQAKLMDPQERIFLESCYHAIEDAGYTPENLGKVEKIGVFAGVMNSRYAPQPAHFSIANRVSFLFNFQGPSMAVDTACSSSLTAIHLALESIYSGECVCALAGGVNLIIDPVHYVQLTDLTMLSSGNQCKAFGEQADGTVDAEGVGVVILKPLHQAQQDGDHIYGVLKGSAINAGGRTNGYTVPNSTAQSKLVLQALERANVLAENLSYIEAHGTGTPLGDPIEIAGLTRALTQTTGKKQYCSIGSLKSNIGHCESAAGIAGLTKVLLQLKYQQLAPSLYAEVPNPEIDFSQTPFKVQQKLETWQRPKREIDGVVREIPRIAGISSFGAGGANAHVIVQEYQPLRGAAEPAPPAQNTQFLILLSAASTGQLKQKAADLLHFIRQSQQPPLAIAASMSGAATDCMLDLGSMAYTLQVGREAMEERLGLNVSSVEQLADKLACYVAGDRVLEDAYQGQVKRGQDGLSSFSSDADLQSTIEKWIANGKLFRLLELWVKGLDLDWSKLYGNVKPQRMSLPLYPFAKERYWIDTALGKHGDAQATAVLHPLLHRNTSDLSEQRFTSTFTGDEFFLVDHQVKLEGHAGQKVLPAVAYLEMARAALQQAWPALRDGLELRNVAWAQPMVVTSNQQISIALWARNSDEVDFEIYSQDAEQETVHCQGLAVRNKLAEPDILDLEQLRGEMQPGPWEPDRVYAAWRRMGVTYGPTFQGITGLHVGNKQVLASLRLPVTAPNAPGTYVLHPGLMDSAQQAAVGLIDGLSGASGLPRVPFALDSLRIISPCRGEMVVWVRYALASTAGDILKLDIDLCDERGNVCVQMHGLSSRALSKQSIPIPQPAETTGSLLAIPVWQPADIPAAAGSTVYTEHSIILCDLAEVDVEQLVYLLPESQCLSLQDWEQKNIGERYSEYALTCFKRIQTVLLGKPQGKVLVQIVVGDEREQALFTGLGALLKTATLENPQLVGQLLLVSARVTADQLAAQLQAEMHQPQNHTVQYHEGVRRLERWQEVLPGHEIPPVAFKDQGVYLISGGLGGLGILFAKEILKQAPQAKIVLTGRSPVDIEKQALLDDLSTPAGRVSYQQVDVGDLDRVKHLVAAIESEHGQLNGILHSAGVLADNFILKKTAVEFNQVLRPKVTGAYNLDQATSESKLDFFVLFSSISGAMGNVGQADYAVANGFLDQFAAYRNALVADGQRYGRTRSINWGALQAGGMGTDTASRKTLQQTTGMQPMDTATAILAFYRALMLPHDQLLVAGGDLLRLRHALTGGSSASSAPQMNTATVAEAIDSEVLAQRTQEYLRREFSEVLQLPSHKIDPQAALENYGIDSILAMKLTSKLESTFGSLSKTLFFEYQTIAGLAGYFLKAHPAVLRNQLGFERAASTATKAFPAPEHLRPSAPARRRGRIAAEIKPRDRQEIAIVGLAGRYPQAENLQEFWKNLQSGRDCITEIPRDRWDHTQYYDPDPNKPGKTYCKWGGFIADVDKFDPLFFNISPKEAALLDPQERLFLETVWETIEDAGYTRASIAASRVGVFVGAMWGHYELFGVDSILSGDAVIPSSSHASIANRVSYFFDFHGPSIALDTMCSSSLTALHLACEELRNGDIDAAIAGGVNVSIHPSKFLSLSQGKFGATDGKCRSFGDGGDGYVPGEGVGAVLLKPLADALRDGDQIYAVIKGSALNHGGKTNGYTVPNPIAQGDLILDAFKRANIDPQTLGYIETHGTGTSLGDPIEITGLLRAFGAGGAKQFCPIGSVKSNIGHLESAAGIAAVTKALLQIKHRQLVPSLHADPPNPNIDFQQSPFYVQTEVAEWKHTAAHPRRVGVSSFGAGGSNAHLILEEYADLRERRAAPQAASPEAFLLSARSWDALCRYADKTVTFLANVSASLVDIAYTSQIGRTPMEFRLVVLASSTEELKDKLQQWLSLGKGSTHPEQNDVFYGNIREAQYRAGDLIGGRAGQVFLADLLANRDLEKLARLWVLGVDMDWPLLHRNAAPRRVSLPTYPFAKERCWIQTHPHAPIHRAAKQERWEPKPEHPEEKQKSHYYPQWTLRPFAATEEQREAVGPILLLDASEELFLTMSEPLRNGAGTEAIVLVKPGKSFQAIGPNIYLIDPEQEEHFDQLIEDLKRRDLLPRVVLHHDAGVYNLEAKEQVAHQLNHGVYALFYLSKAWIKVKHPVPLKILSVFPGHSVATSPLSAAIGGFFKTLVLENPRCLAKTVELQDVPLAEKASLLWDEIYETDGTAQEIRYLRSFGGEKVSATRYVSELVPHPPAGEKVSALPLRQRGVYLITGGLGGLGLIFAEYLAKNFQAKLVLLGRSSPNAAQQEKLDRLKSYGAELLILPCDVSRLQDLESAVSQAKAQFSQLNGVIHAAGVHRDSFILNKTKEEMDAVLAPKVYGTIHLDLATSAEGLDFFVLFSSIAGVLGNLGQSDYAYGNHFLDSFAATREDLRTARKRSGRTLSINWPLWQEGGMSIAQDDIALLEQQTGLCPLPNREGISYWEDFLRFDTSQGIALYGIPSRITAFLTRKAVNPDTESARGVDAADLLAQTEQYLKSLIGDEIKLAPDRVGSFDRFESFGIDSVMIQRLNASLERDLGALSKTLLYQHETVRELAQFLMQDAADALVKLLGVTAAAADAVIPSRSDQEQTGSYKTAVAADNRDDLEPIAIIGMHGCYPHSANLAEYWENLKQGKDLLDLVPRSRWDVEEFYHPDPAAAADGKIYCKWGGFLEDHDKFDPQFFKISPEEARVIDPQERLFLQSVWAAIEDAGYTRDRLKKLFPKARSADVGVFVGVTTNTYHLWAPEERSRGNNVSPATLPWSIPNRVSYFFDFAGPSLPVDTACSSSLVAVHLACESLKRGECQVAIAGGVNLYLHPAKYQSLCQRSMLSLDGKCHSYGAGDDGFVPGEGVGAMVLKPLSKAIEHGDHIYAVIPSSAFDHAGRSNGYSAPNPNSQANLIRHTLNKAHIHPETIGYVEGHGTGTQLGDSLEVAALTQVFRAQSSKKQFCSIGSVKANIGHAESAAGVAGIAKVILQLEHRQLAPSIYSDQPNPNIEFQDSPFYLQHGLSEWKASPAHPRRALVNAFGAGGVNACVVLEEYREPPLLDAPPFVAPCLFTLSAKTEDRLREYVHRLLLQLKADRNLSLGNVCYTLQVGREPMEERFATVVSHLDELIDRLTDWLNLKSSTQIYRGSTGTRSRSSSVLAEGQSLTDLASLWVAGHEVAWESLYPSYKPRRIPLPNYPFARERYWIATSLLPQTQPVAPPQLHPLVSYNSSTLKEISFTSALSDTAFYAVDHQVNREGIFPAAGFLEMACVSGNIAGEHRVRKITDIVWARPLSFRKGPQAVRTSLKQVDDAVEYVISSLDDEEEAIVHAEGKLTFSSHGADAALAPDPMAIEVLKSQCKNRVPGDAYYDNLRKHGIDYGPSFQTIQEIYTNDSFVLSKLKIPDRLKNDFAQFILHPSMIDGALQTVAALVAGLASTAPHLPFALDEMNILHPVRQTCYAYAEFAGSLAPNRAGITKFNIRLLNESGDVLIDFKNLFARPLPFLQVNPQSANVASSAIAGDA